MIRRTMAALMLVTLMAGGAYAQDCDQKMQGASQKIAAMNAGGGKRAALLRMALQGYDYCMAGDTFNAERFWEMVESRAK